MFSLIPATVLGNVKVSPFVGLTAGLQISNIFQIDKKDDLSG